MIVVEIHTSHVIETYTPRTACSFRAVVSRGARAVAGESGIDSLKSIRYLIERNFLGIVNDGRPCASTAGVSVPKRVY